MRRALNRGIDRAAAIAALGVVLLALAGTPLAAQPREVASAGARAAQFVFVIDDSGSMEETDPDRLAVFAARSLLGMLDDRDEVSIVRLNGPYEGAAPPPIEPLRRNRRRMESLLALDGPIAAYGGEYTPCASALSAVRRLLEQAHRPEVAQVVFFLTDGACTPRDQQPEPGLFLTGLPSFGDGLFQLYLLRFRGMQFSDALGNLARSSGGAVIEADAGEPTSLLDAFAQALSRSQGYRSHLLGPDERRLPAHRGAERVRLLAVAPGPGPELSFSLGDRRGRGPEVVGPTRAGTHRYRNGRVFRFAALDYRPGAGPVTVDVEGAGRSWKVVALPEYRLSLRLSLFEGRCSERGPEAEYGLDTGSSLCAVARLVGGDGRPVTDLDAGRGLDVRFVLERPDRPGSEPLSLAAKPLGDGRHAIERRDLDTGDYQVHARAELDVGGAADRRDSQLVLTAPARSLQVSSLVVEPSPRRFDLGTLTPGEQVTETVTFTGVFPATAAWIELRGREDLPACLHATLSGVPEGPPDAGAAAGERTLEIGVDQSHTLTVAVAPYCGPRSFERRIDTAVRLVFDPAESARRFPVVEIPLRLTLRYEIEPPRELRMALPADEAAAARLVLGGNFTEPPELTARVAAPDAAETASWPEDEDELVVGLAGERGRGAPVREGTVAFGPGGGAELTARTRRCCPGGTYRTVLGLNAAPDQPVPPDSAALDWLLVPVVVEVEGAGLWACRGPLIMAVAAALLLFLLLLYLFSMWRNSSFLNPRILASRLRPLVWGGHGETVEQGDTGGQVLRLVRKELTPWRRALAWLKANPLRFGLPGGSYRETVELFLQPNPDLPRSQVRLVSKRDLLSDLEEQPDRYVGRLFAVARAGVTFFAIPDANQRVNAMEARLFQPLPAAGEEGGARPVRLRDARLIAPLEEWESRDPGAAAGWAVG